MRPVNRVQLFDGVSQLFAGETSAAWASAAERARRRYAGGRGDTALVLQAGCLVEVGI